MMSRRSMDWYHRSMDWTARSMNWTLILSIVICHMCFTQAANPYFWHITDFHLDPTYQSSQDSCNEEIASPGTYGSYECDAPYELIHSSVLKMRLIGGSPTFILYSGDAPYHSKNYTVAGFDEERVTSFLTNITDLLNSTFHDTQVVVAVGNHDYYPKSQLPGETNSMYKTMASMWAPWFNHSQDAKTTFEKGAYYTMLIDPALRLRVVVLNTNLYMVANDETDPDTDPADQYTWLRGVLQSAQQQQERVHLILHVPTGVMMAVYSHARWLRDQDNTELNSIVRDYSDVIIAMYSSHEHLDSFRIIYKDGKPVVPEFIAPSVTPWRSRLGGGVLGPPHNPAMRKIEYDQFTGELVNIEQYYLRLPTANQDEDPNWIKLYTFTGAYDVDNLTAPEIHRLSERFKEYGNGDFHDYYDWNVVSLEEPYYVPCGCDCKFQYICSIQNVDYDDFDACTSAIICGASMSTHTMVLLVLSVLLHRVVTAPQE